MKPHIIILLSHPHLSHLSHTTLTMVLPSSDGPKEVPIPDTTTETKTQDEGIHVVIIGAGLAGLAAALSTKLANPNHQVTILEAVKELQEVGVRPSPSIHPYSISSANLSPPPLGRPPSNPKRHPPPLPLGPHPHPRPPRRSAHLPLRPPLRRDEAPRPRTKPPRADAGTVWVPFLGFTSG